MELRQLEYFIAVAEEGSFTRAAERTHVSQPGISAQIRQLEHDLGATLIDRSGRTAGLTTAGAAALPHARAALAAVSAVRQAVDEVNGLVRGRLVVGMVTACTVTPLFDALAEFHREHPGIELCLVEDNSERLIEQVRSGALDLALVGAADEPPQGLDSLVIVSERLVAAVPFGHPLAEQRRARLADLTAYPVVCLPKGTGTRTVFDRACAALGTRPEIALQAGAPTTVADLAARGLGVAILSESMTAVQDGKLAVLPLEDVEIPALLALVWHGTGNVALRSLLAFCRQAFAPVR
ncbi:LysR family transcriptional regulator [Kitasatospora sp. NPDC002227]|uniref:LysR family transcriptional regulator n=1 Tax=Kitasatospora sp. NPDC002227 TaxID=3154773 RepID=UPI00332BC34B